MGQRVLFIHRLTNFPLKWAVNSRGHVLFPDERDWSAQPKISKPVLSRFHFWRWRQTLKTRISIGHELLRLFSTAMKATTFVVLLCGLAYGQFCQLYADEPWRTSITPLGPNV